MTVVWALAVLGLLLLVAVLALALRKPPDVSTLLGPLSNLTQGLGALQSDLRGLAERIATVERDQGRVGMQVAALDSRLAETGSLAQGLAETAAAIRTGLGAAHETLASLQSHAQARQQVEQRTADSIRRLEAVMAGTRSKGAAGENLIDPLFAQLPPEWQARNVQVGNKTVEFGSRLPNGRLLPIGSTWFAPRRPQADTSPTTILKKAWRTFPSPPFRSWTARPATGCSGRRWTSTMIKWTPSTRGPTSA